MKPGQGGGEVAVTHEESEHARSTQPSRRVSEANPAEARYLHAEVVAYEAVTPAVVPLEPMIVLDASGSEVDPQRSAPPAQKEEGIPPEASVLNVDELAALLRVERKTVYAAIARGEIPGVRRVGSLLRVSRDRVLAWLAQGQDRVSRSRRSP
jgi:excisionase family DNA binding protein